MSTGYAVAYRLGITPWEKAGPGADDAFGALIQREEEGRERPFGRALDLGCGTGAHTRQLEARGWDAMGVDNVRVAVDRAIRRGGADSRFVIGDVAHLKGCGVGAEFSLFLDVGCFDGLNAAHRTAMARGVTQVAAPDATLLLLCSAPHRSWGRSRGADRDAVARAFPGWSILSIEEADTTGLSTPLQKNAPHWFRLRLS